MDRVDVAEEEPDDKASSKLATDIDKGEDPVVIVAGKQFDDNGRDVVDR